ncbi:MULTISPECIES: hypothetical protein [unclassified Nocardia]|uniref:hypothetical protein n=1 Tax=unclassified Nocardia TaxID=2637762 RepID=UPI001CE40AB8|nr:MULTISPECIES: hypothetical protein [unclassified Nocardia]
MKRIGIGTLAAGAVLFAAGLGATPAMAAPGLPLEQATVDTTPSQQAQPVVGTIGSGSSAPGLACSLSGYGPTNNCFNG